MTMEKQLVGNKIVKIKATLPDEVITNLKNLPLEQRKAYAKRLVEAGWTYVSIGNAIGISRQAVEQYVNPSSKVKYKEEMLKEVEHLPIPALPTKPIYKQKRREVSPDVLKELQDLHSKAKLVRGKAKTYRDEAEQFTDLAWKQVNEEGVSTYSLAKSLGITHGALLFRFVRYGYTTSEGQSKVYQKVQHRKRGEENA